MAGIRPKKWLQIIQATLGPTMCILFFAFDVSHQPTNHHDDLGKLGISHPFRLLLANNRDEFLQRPTERVDWWNDIDKKVLAPQDLDPKGDGNHGTWLGITKTGRFAVLTNYREDPSTWTKDALSRGFVVRDYLCGTHTPQAFCEQVHSMGSQWNGFNLVCGHLSKESTVWYVCNREDIKPCALVPNRIYGLSNGTLQSTEWPKVSHGITVFKEALTKEIGTIIEPESPRYAVSPLVETMDTPHAQLIATILDDVLSDTSTFPNHRHAVSTWDPSLSKACQSVCVPPGRYRVDYGTRTQSVIVVDGDGWTDYAERELFQDTLPDAPKTVGYTNPVEWSERWVKIDNDVVHKRFHMEL